MERRVKINRFILRLLIFCVGLVFLSLGIDLNTKTQLGISPINSVPFNVHQLAGILALICVYTLYLPVLMCWMPPPQGFPSGAVLQLATSFICSILIQFFDDHIPLSDQVGQPACSNETDRRDETYPEPRRGAAGAIGIALKKRTSVTERTCWISAACGAPLHCDHPHFSGRISNIGIGTVLSMLVTGRIVKLSPRPPESYTKKSLLNHTKDAEG